LRPMAIRKAYVDVSMVATDCRMPKDVAIVG
jgi:hypothetical protein